MFIGHGVKLDGHGSLFFTTRAPPDLPKFPNGLEAEQLGSPICVDTYVFLNDILFKVIPAA